MHLSTWTQFLLVAIVGVIVWFVPPYLLVCLLGRKFLRLSSGSWSLSNRGMFLFYLLALIWAAVVIGVILPLAGVIKW
jgi:hypothetical protein